MARRHTLPSADFRATIAANVDNGRLSDAEFREFVRNSLRVVDYQRKDVPRNGSVTASGGTPIAPVLAMMPEHDRIVQIAQDGTMRVLRLNR